MPSFPTGEALHGVNAGCGVDTAGRKYCPTSFPSALGMGASLNDTLWNLVGSTISTESRALTPAGGARWAPDINLFRDPRWCVVRLAVCRIARIAPLVLPSYRASTLLTGVAVWIVAMSRQGTRAGSSGRGSDHHVALRRGVREGNAGGG